MADGYISQIKTPDNKVYLLKDSAKTDEKVKQTANTEDKEFPIILKNANNATPETNGVKYAGGVTVNPSEKTVTATEFIGKLNMGRLVPIDTKTYNAPLYQSSGANFYQNFATVTPVDYNAIWIAHYRITITAAGHSDYTEICDVSISGRNNTWYTYNIYNSIVTYSIYQHMLLNSNSATVPHELGYRMQGSYGADTVQKVVKVELLEQLNCTVTLLDNLKLYTSATPSGYTWRGFNATSNGLQETGDNDAYGYYILSNGFKGKAGSNKVYRQCLFARTGDGTYESFVMESNTRATTKTANPHGFVPDGKIYWNSSGSDYSAGTLNISPYEQYHVIDYLYSFNFDNQFLPDYCETYVVYTYNEDDGLLYLDTTQWLAAALPTTEDGKIYQRIGSKYYTGTSNYYQGSLLLDNPYYEFKNGKIRTWAPSTRGIKSITRSGTTFTATRDDGSTFNFTQQDTNKYHKSGSWSGLTYTATAVNSADELKFTIPNKIQTNWELNATSGNSPALLFTRDGSLTDWRMLVTSGKLSFQSATDGSTWTERAYFKDNSGDFVATSFTGKGSDLTDLNGSNISSGTVAAARIDSAIARLASPALTGVPTAPTAANGTSTTQIATTAFVNNTLSYVNAMRFKGTLGTGGTVTALPASHEAGDTYRVITAGTWADKYCELGTLIICTTDGTAASDAHWTAVETNEDGAVIGPSSSTGNNITTFSGNTGRIIQDSGKAFSTTAPGSSSTDAQIPTSKAVWSAITGASGYGKTGTVTSITLTQGAGITVSDSGIAISTSGSRTISITGMNTSSGATNKWLNQKGEWTTPPNDNTDTQVNVTATGAAISHNYILMTSTAPTATATGHTALGSTSLWINSADKGKFELVLGNSTATTTAGGQYGQLALYSAKTAGTYLKAADGTTWSTQTLQAKDGTIALTSDIPSGVSKTAAGLCPQLPNETTTTKFLRQDGTWQVPDYIADTHYTTHLYVNATAGGATSNAATANTTTYMHLYDNSTKRETIQFKGSGATTVTATGGVITINSTDNNTATATDNILDGSNSGTAITYAPYTAQQSKLSFDTSTTTPTRTDRLNLNGFLYATQYNVAGKVTLQWNATDSSLDFVFA